MAALPLSKARVILHLPDAEERETLAKRATEENLTVRNLEEQIKQLTNDVSEARKSEHRMAQEVQQAQDMRARLDADRRKLEGDRYEMIQKQRERQAEIERLRAALAQAEQQKPQEGISPEAQRQIDALRQELADAEDYAEQQATLRQEAQRQLLEQQSSTASSVGNLPGYAGSCGRCPRIYRRGGYLPAHGHRAGQHGRAASGGNWRAMWT